MSMWTPTTSIPTTPEQQQAQLDAVAQSLAAATSNVNQQVSDAQGTLAAAKAAAEADLQQQQADALQKISDQQSHAYDQVQAAKQDAENEVLARQRDLDNNLAGFLTGAIAPAYATGQSGVQVRDSYMGFSGTAPVAAKPKGPSFAALAVAGGAFYYFFLRKRGAL